MNYKTIHFFEIKKGRLLRTHKRRENNVVYKLNSRTLYKLADIFPRYFYVIGLFKHKFICKFSFNFSSTIRFSNKMPLMRENKISKHFILAIMVKYMYHTNNFTHKSF